MKGKKMKKQQAANRNQLRHEQLMKDTVCTEVLAMVTSLSRAETAAAAPPAPAAVAVREGDHGTCAGVVDPNQPLGYIMQNTYLIKML